MPGAQGGQLSTSHGVPHQNRGLNFERVEDLENIIRQTLIVVARLGVTGMPESPARDGVDVATVR